MSRRSLSLVLSLFALTRASAQTQAGSSSSPSDPYVWLEDQRGARAMAWVATENAKTAAVLEKDSHFASLFRDALAVAQASDRIPNVHFIGGQIYNFWQDSAHVRGIWRRTTLASYRTASPQWTTVLDLDSLAHAEKANWVWEGADCAMPAERRCLLSLSDGGEDAVTLREFDLATHSFPKDGFVLPHGKQNVAWVGEDTLLVSREWNKGELTASGYPYIVKRIVRGQPLTTAVEVYRGIAKDVSVGPASIFDGGGHRALILYRGVSFFETEYYGVGATGVTKLALPLKSRPVAMVDGQLIVKLSEAWNDGATHIRTGSLASFDVAKAAANPTHLSPVAVFEPGPRESVDGASATRDRLVATVYENVRGRAFVFTRAANGTWTRAPLPLPDNLAVSIADVESARYRSALERRRLSHAEQRLARRRARGVDRRGQDASRAIRRFARHGRAARGDVEGRNQGAVLRRAPKAMKLDGANPTVMTAYGGFEVTSTPFYSGTIGKLWLEHGGVFVLANIRGGGEFGPAWHEAGLKTHRQVIYDDFAAVAQDLIARKITTPRRLGIVGGSNGGLLMGVELTQHPDLWNAVDIQVPLLDMLRYEQIDAGASWVGEYGSVSVPAERAFLASISPYQNLKTGVKYPEPLIWTTTKDDRVGPQHARKFAAKMSAMGLPYLFFEVTEGGHGAGANLREKAHTSAMEYVYFSRKLMN